MWPGLSEAGNSVVPVLFPELAAPLTRSQRRELKASLASKPPEQEDGLEPSPSEPVAGFILVAFGAAPVFEHGGPEQCIRNQPFPSSIHLETTSAKIN